MRDSHSTLQHPQAQRKRSAWAMIGLAGILVLTGCVTDTNPTPPPETTSNSTGTGTSTQTVPPSTAAPGTAAAYRAATANGPALNVPVPTLPVKAKEFSKDGLLAFAEYWYSTLGYAFETGDSEPLIEITGTGCRNCDAMKDTVVSWHSEGRWIVGGQMFVLSQMATFKPVQDGTYQVISMVRQQNVKFYRSDKTLAGDRGPQSAIADILVATYVGDRWTADNVEHLEGSKGSKGSKE